MLGELFLVQDKRVQRSEGKVILRVREGVIRQPGEMEYDSEARWKQTGKQLRIRQRLDRYSSKDTYAADGSSFLYRFEV